MKLNFKKNNELKQNQYRSSSYDWFNHENGPGFNKKKQKFKKIWKTIRIFMYIFLAALSLTGCIQSFVIKTDNYTGQGMEMYSKKAFVAPHITSVIWNKQTEKLTFNAKANYWLNPDDKEDFTFLKQIHQQIKQGGGDIATWGTENQAIQYIEVNNKDSITNIERVAKTNYNKNLLVLGESEVEGQGVFGKLSDSIQIDPIKLLAVEEHWDSLTNNKAFKIVEKIYNFSDGIVTSNNSKNFMETVFFQYYNKIRSQYPKNALNSTIKTYKNRHLADAELIKINYPKYLNNLQRLQNYTGMQFKTKIVNNKSTNIFEMTNKGIISFDRSGSLKLKAIYNWSTAWSLGPFYGLFVYPLSQLTLSIIEGMPSWSGWESIISIFLVVIIIRTLAYLLTFKSTLQQVKQQELSAKRAAIETKYAPYKGNKQMEQRKRQEMAEMFKKEGISPLGALGSIFLTMPIFLTMWRLIGGIAHFKSTTWLGINFSATSYQELFAGKWQYLPLIFVTGIVQGCSSFLPRLLTKGRDKKRINAHQRAALKKTNKTQNIIMIAFIFISFISTGGIQIYLIFGGLFTIFQNILNHFIIKKQSIKRKYKRVK